MIPNGVYIREGPDYLAHELSAKLEGLDKIESTGNLQTAGTDPSGRVTVYIHERGYGWCHIEMAGEASGIALVMDFLTAHKSLEKVMVWDCSEELAEYSYTLFQGGKLLEQFSVKGPTLDAVSFISELRKVRLQDLIRGRDFALEALEHLGIFPKSQMDAGVRRIRLDFSLPPRTSKWRLLLGSLSGRE